MVGGAAVGAEEWWLGMGLWEEWLDFLELGCEQSRERGGGREERGGGVWGGVDAVAFAGPDLCGEGCGSLAGSCGSC